LKWTSANTRTWASISGGATLSDITSDSTSTSRKIVTTTNSGGGSMTTAEIDDDLYYRTDTGTLSATTFNSTSDINRKTNIRTIDNALEIIDEIRGVRFDWKYNGAPSIGVIAQEVEKVLPELVEVNHNGSKTVSYGNLVAILIQGIKEQQLSIMDLNEKIKNLT